MCRKTNCIITGAVLIVVFLFGIWVGFFGRYWDLILAPTQDPETPLSSDGNYFLQAGGISYRSYYSTLVESRIFAYQVKDNRLYMYGASGYTVVDMISGKAKKYPQNYYTGAEGKAALDDIYLSKLETPWENEVKNSVFKDDLTYLNSWSEWTEEEQKIFDVLKTEGKEKYEQFLKVTDDNVVRSCNH